MKWKHVPSLQKKCVLNFEMMLVHKSIFKMASVCLDFLLSLRRIKMRILDFVKRNKNSKMHRLEFLALCVLCGPVAVEVKQFH